MKIFTKYDLLILSRIFLLTHEIIILILKIFSYLDIRYVHGLLYSVSDLFDKYNDSIYIHFYLTFFFFISLILLYNTRLQFRRNNIFIIFHLRDF